MKFLKLMNRKHTAYMALAICFAAICVFCCPTGVVAEEVYVEPEVVETGVDLSEIDIYSGLTNDDLASGYIGQVMPSKGRIRRAPRLQGENLEGGNLNAYLAVKNDIQDIANGSRTSTAMTYPAADIYSKTTLMAEDLGLEYIYREGAWNPGISQAVTNWMANEVQFPTVLRALLADCPYELYWFDKTVGYSYGHSSYSYSSAGYVRLTGTFRVWMTVSQNYAALDGNGSYNLYEVNPIYGLGVQAAAQNAQSIVSQYESLDNYNRLLAYKTRIHELTSYNYDAAENDPPYGDPWQLIWVFDGNSATNVVCEGYSKAFKYLNDLSNGSAEVILATGDMDGGGHMWNIVRMEDGRNYMADITNTDTGTIGYPDLLFLVGTRNGSVSEGYTFYAHVNIPYVYDDDLGFSEEELTIASMNYLEYRARAEGLSLSANAASVTTLQDVTITGTALTAESVELRIYEYEGSEEYESIDADGTTVSAVRNWRKQTQPYIELVATYDDGETMETSLTLSVTAANSFGAIAIHKLPSLVFGEANGVDAYFEPLTGAEIYDVRVTYSPEGTTPEEILFRTFEANAPDADYSLTLSPSQLSGNGTYTIAVTAAGTNYQETTQMWFFEVTDATADGDVAVLLDRTSVMTGELVQWRIYASGAECLTLDVWTENGDYLIQGLSNDDEFFEAKYYSAGGVRMIDVSGLVYFQGTAQMPGGITVTSPVVAVTVTSLGTLSDPQIITGLWYAGDDFSVTIQPDPDTDYYALRLSQNGQTIYDTEIGAELEGNQTIQMDAADLQPGACITMQVVQRAEAMISNEKNLNIWPIDPNAVLALPDDLTSIEEEAFMGATQIRHVILSGEIDSVGEDAFAGSGLKTIQIPANVTGFDGDIFGTTDVTVYGYAASEAEEYANDLGVSFVRIQ